MSKRSAVEYKTAKLWTLQLFKWYSMGLSINYVVSKSAISVDLKVLLIFFLIVLPIFISYFLSLLAVVIL
jgi:hypothetical protein